MYLPRVSLLENTSGFEFVTQLTNTGKMTILASIVYAKEKTPKYNEI
jgi:hypothetical protein